MEKHALWKWLILVVMIAFSLALVVPLKEKVRLGLDLEGGTSFVVAIEEQQIAEKYREESPDLSDAELAERVANALRDAQPRVQEVIRNRINGLGIEEPIVYAERHNRIVVQLPGVGERKREEAARSIKKAAFLEFRMVHESNAELVEELFEQHAAPDGFRVTWLGGKPYYVRDRTQVKDDDMDAAFHDRLRRFHVPSQGYEFLLEKEEQESQEVFVPYFVKRRPELTGESLKDSGVNYGPLGQPEVTIEFDRRGGRKFARVTGDYAPGGAKNPNPQQTRQMAIVLDGTLYSAPAIKEAIHGGRAKITGRFSLREAQFLANVLRAGALPVPVEIVETRAVDPSLGEDSIRSSVRAVLIGGVGVVVFMAGYYLLSGVVADLALALNMILLPLGMVAVAGFLGMLARAPTGGSALALPVLTLPGIAGILLTIGMSVDANVLIFERMREELQTGKRLWTSIVAGYDRAFVTILDANVTTLLTGAILFFFGSGPVRGFAVTLCAGILISMFTALVVTRLLFNVLSAYTPISRLRMLRLIGDTAFDFVARRRLAAILSVAAIAASWAVMSARFMQDRTRVLGVDFTGGAEVTFSFTRKQSVEAVRDALGAKGIVAQIQYQRRMVAAEYLAVTAAPEALEGVTQALQEAFPDAGYAFAESRDAGQGRGAVMTFTFGEPVPIGDVRQALAGRGLVAEAGYESAREVGAEFLTIRTSFGLGEEVKGVLKDAFPEAGIRFLQANEVGPQIGSELTWRAVLAIAIALLAIVIYLAIRFELGFAVGAIVALAHDVLVTAGLYSLCGRQISLPVVAALLTIVGYSVNDTIVVFDRIREDLRVVRNRSFREICNLSINQTLSRTVLTSLTTLIVIVMLLLFGGGAILDFALALCIGVVVGTYSSVFVATPVVLLWHRDKRPDLGTARAT